MKVAIEHTRLGLRNSRTRIPFRYGTACLTACPQAVLEVRCHCEPPASGEQLSVGYAGDCLPPRWFDKSPHKDFRQQLVEMLAAIEQAQRIYTERFAGSTPFFPGWLDAHSEVERAAADRGFTQLLAGFASSLVERALLDALCRAAGLSFGAAWRRNLFGIEPDAVHPELAGLRPADWLPPSPSRSIWVRHTVGLGDPLTIAEIPPDERLHDGFPQALEEHIVESGVRYFKIKVSNRLDDDLARLRAVAAVVERHRGADYQLTLDGNEQFKDAQDLAQLVAAIQADASLATLWRNTLAIEQPLDRGIALDTVHAADIRELCRHKPVIIDESDGTLHAYREAFAVGYRGVSSKACKGAVKSVLNAGLTWLGNQPGDRLGPIAGPLLMTGEDLCSVGVLGVQGDLCLAATLGLEHVERNGHHYHPGLTYLPEAERIAALAAHGDFYHQRHHRVVPRVAEGRMQIGSLVECAGMGFASLPSLDERTPARSWEYDSLFAEEG